MKTIYLTSIAIVVVLCAALLLGKTIVFDMSVGGSTININIIPPRPQAESGGAAGHS